MHDEQDRGTHILIKSQTATALQRREKDDSSHQHESLCVISAGVILGIRMGAQARRSKNRTPSTLQTRSGLQQRVSETSCFCSWPTLVSGKWLCLLAPIEPSSCVISLVANQAVRILQIRQTFSSRRSHPAVGQTGGHLDNDDAPTAAQNLMPDKMTLDRDARGCCHHVKEQKGDDVGNQFTSHPIMIYL